MATARSMIIALSVVSLMLISIVYNTTEMVSLYEKLPVKSIGDKVSDLKHIIQKRVGNIIADDFETKEPSTTATTATSTTTTSGGYSEDIEDEGSCQCKQVGWPNPKATQDILNASVSWYNMTEEESMRRHHPNLPLKTFRDAIQSTRCHLMPNIFSINWVNSYWQKTKASQDSTFLLYSAFYDNRPRTDVRPCVRLLGLSAKKPEDIFCYLWFNATGPPVFSKIIRINYLDWQGINTNRLSSFLLTCRVPNSMSHLVPEAASLVEKPCLPANNILKVVGARDRDPKTAFTNGKGPQDPHGRTGWAAVVCGPALFYYHEDVSIRLVEWLEIYRALGLSKVILYETDVHPNIQKVLTHYELQGFVEMVKFSYPPPYIDEESLRRLFVLVERHKMFAMENVYFTDCVLRYMHQYRFLAHHDPDEVPILRSHQNYTAFLDHLMTTSLPLQEEGNLPPDYKFQWNFHFDDIEPGPSSKHLPQYLWVLRHNKRLKTDLKPTRGKYKSLYDLDPVTGVYSHHALLCGSGSCDKHKTISPKEAYLGHFKLNCGDACKKNDSMIEENALSKFADQVQKNVAEVLNELKLL